MSKRLQDGAVNPPPGRALGALTPPGNNQCKDKSPWY
jgi:hypothetical protein